MTTWIEKMPKGATARARQRRVMWGCILLVGLLAAATYPRGGTVQANPYINKVPK